MKSKTFLRRRLSVRFKANIPGERSLENFHLNVNQTSLKYLFFEWNLGSEQLTNVTQVHICFLITIKVSERDKRT